MTEMGVLEKRFKNWIATAVRLHPNYSELEILQLIEWEHGNAIKRFERMLGEELDDSDITGYEMAIVLNAKRAFEAGDIIKRTLFDKSTFKLFGGKIKKSKLKA